MAYRDDEVLNLQQENKKLLAENAALKHARSKKSMAELIDDLTPAQKLFYRIPFGIIATFAAAFFISGAIKLGDFSSAYIGIPATVASIVSMIVVGFICIKTLVD